MLPVEGLFFTCL